MSLDAVRAAAIAPSPAVSTAGPSTYQQRKEASLCTRCGADAAEDSSLCEEHRDDLKERRKKWIGEFRAERRADGLCPYCPKARRTKIGKGEAMCRACRIARHRQPALVEVVDSAVDRAARILAATNKDPDGRTRYRGQQKRGQQPKEQLIEQDLRYMRECLDAALGGYRELVKEEVKAMPRIQREDIGRAADHQIARVLGHGEELLERRGHWKVRHGPRGDK